jgi:Zn-dependent protease with chaperone function
MRTGEVTRRLRHVATITFMLLAVPGLGLAALATWVLTRGVPICWPRTLGGPGCALFLGAGLFCWLLAGTMVAAGGWQWTRTALGLVPVLRRRPSMAGERLAERFGLTGAVTVVFDAGLWALTYGLARPRIALSSGLLARLADDELSAVLLHEECHRRCREPLRLLLARTARAVLWFLPAAGRLLDSYVMAAELGADACAMEQIGRRPLAQALWKLRDAGPSASAVSFAPSPGLFRRRVDQLERYPEPAPAPWPRWSDALATVAAVATAAFWALSCLHV